MTTFTARSKDGTVLTCKTAGQGPPLLLIHGAGNYSARWESVISLLHQDFSIYAMDRRGRGESGDGPAYALEREFEDAASVVDAIGGPVDVLGHSLGAICAMEASFRTANIRKLILYEPPIPMDGPLISNETLDRLDSLLKAGDRESVLLTMMLEVIQVPPNEVEFLRSSPVWKERLAVAHTLPREFRGANAYRLDAARVRGLMNPTLLLLGGNSPAVFRDPIRVLGATLPRGETVVLEGQRHNAIDSAPLMFAQTVKAFLGNI